jgi:hypothetical protein
MRVEARAPRPSRPVANQRVRRERGRPRRVNLSRHKRVTAEAKRRRIGRPRRRSADGFPDPKLAHLVGDVNGFLPLLDCPVIATTTGRRLVPP